MPAAGMLLWVISEGKVEGPMWLFKLKVPVGIRV